MIISSSQIQSLLQVYGKKDSQYSPNKRIENAKPNIGKDKSVVSEQAKAFQIAKQTIKDVPDVREDKIKDIKNRVKTGSYSVSDDEIAEKMLGRSLVDKLV